MMSLEKTSGLPLILTDEWTLEFGEGILPADVQKVELGGARNFFKNQEAGFPRRELYRVYRDLTRLAHKQAFRDFGVQYDLTLIPPGKIGEEFVRTRGHYHATKAGTAVAFPEVYEVVLGRTLMLLQSADPPDFERLREIYLVEMRRGEKLVIPPGFGHVAINPGEEVLVLSNLQARANRPIYEPYEAHGGPGYFVVESPELKISGALELNEESVPNLNYKQVPALIHRRPRDLPQFELRSSLPVYFTATQDLSSLDFLINPENYLEELKPERLFR